VELDEDTDLVVVDLEEAPPLSLRNDREAFDEQFAQLAFGLGTVRRRVHADRASRAPMWVLLLTVVAMLAVLLGNPSPSRSSSADLVPDAPRLLDAPTSARVVIVGSDRIEAVDVDRRLEHVVRLAGIPDGTATAAVSAGDSFAAIVGGRAWGATRHLDAAAIDLGPADALFASTAEGWVWLGVAKRAGWEFRQVSTTTGVGGGYTLTESRVGTGRPVGVLDPDGLVLDRIDGGRRVIGSGTSSRAVPRRESVLGLADTSVVTLDCGDQTCTVVSRDLKSRDQRRIDTPLPSEWSIGPSALSRGGQGIAALTGPSGSDTTRALIVAPGVSRVVALGGRGTALAWSADWLFVTLDDGRLVAIGPAGGAQVVAVAPLPRGALIGA
jgi:hypothetical protein